MLPYDTDQIDAASYVGTAPVLKRFRDREDAARRLASALAAYAAEQTVVLALPRGGVPVAYEVARALGAPLDVCVVRKIGVPWHTELGLGAVAEGGHVYLSRDLVSSLGVSQAELSRAIETKLREVEDRVQRFRTGRPRLSVEGRTCSWSTTGSRPVAPFARPLRPFALTTPNRPCWLRPSRPRTPSRSLRRRSTARWSCWSPELHAIGLWYEDFGQVPDEEVMRLLERARSERANRSGAT